MPIKSDIISEWREGHKEELDKCLAVLQGIRDDTEAADKNRIDAATAIARLMGAISTDGKTKLSSMTPDKAGLTKAHEAELEELLSELV